MKKVLFLLFITAAFQIRAQESDLLISPKSDVFMQGFYWNSTPGGIWYDSLMNLAPRLASSGFSAIWFPSPVKGAGGGFSMGYDPYDHYDFGDYQQKGSKETRFGSKSELINSINAFRSVGISVLADAVIRHMMGGEIKAPYQCRPMYNGQYIVPDSAYLVFNYPSGSKRFKKDPGTFYPNSQNCFVDPLFVQTDPQFRFGEWLDHNKQPVKDSLVAWGNYLKNTIKFEGFRLDAVKAINPVFAGFWLSNTNLNNYAVAEYWGSTSEIINWLNTCKSNGGSVAMFDFPLRYTLKDMCNNTSGSFDMNNLDGAGLVNSGVSGFDVSTFVENHDFDRIGWDGQIDNGHDPIITNKDMAYAYTLFSEGRPCVFFKDYFGYGFAGKIDTLIWIRRTFIYGGTTKRSGLNPWYVGGSGSQIEQSQDIYVARRNGGNGKPQVYLVINDNPTQWRGVWVNSDHPNKVFRDFTGRAIDKLSAGDGRVELWAPPRSYAVYVPDTTQRINNPPVILPINDQLAFTNSNYEYKIKVFDVNNQTLNFSATGKPGWLNLSPNGLLTGVPSFADTGLSTIIITVSDPLGETERDTFNLRVLKNLPPHINSITDTIIYATKRFEYQTIGNDPDGDSLKFFFSNSPTFLIVNDRTGFISGTPSQADTGIYLIKLKVTDYKGAFDSTAFNLTVKKAQDSVIFTYGKPVIDGNITVGSNDWLQQWQITADSDTDSYWHPRDSLGNPTFPPDNELFGLFATWDADSLYIGADYVINDLYNTLMLYIDAGLNGGETNFNSNQGYYGDYAKNFRFRTRDAIDYFLAAYYQNKPSLFKIVDSTSEDKSSLINPKRGTGGKDFETAIAWNTIYGLGAGLVPPNIKLKFVSVVSGGFNWGGGDSSPDNLDINGNSGPDSLINLVQISPDLDGNGIPDPTIILDVEENRKKLFPASYSLSQNYPNPFNPVTKIQFTIPLRQHVTLKVYDILGNEIITLLDEEKSQGTYNIVFSISTKDNSAKDIASGIYFYRLKAGNFVSTKKMILLK
jgi:alpha-amylase